MSMVERIYAARRLIIQKRSDIITAIKNGDRDTAARLRDEVEQLRVTVLREYKIIID